MKYLFLITIMMMNVAAFADSIRSKIHSIDRSTKKGAPHLILMESGRVVFVPYTHTKDLESFESSLDNKETLLIETDEKGNAEAISTVAGDVTSRAPLRERNFSYQPSIVSDAEANTYFSRMRRNYQSDSQCYNRAMVWTYEENQKSKINSMKLFMFFTRRYIRNYRYKWWFHVTPMVYQKDGDNVVMTVLDRMFMRSPASVEAWTKKFIYSGRSCPVVSRYSQYSRNQEAEDCYQIPVSMYYWQPRDIENFEKTGVEKTSFVPYDVNYAYWESF